LRRTRNLENRREGFGGISENIGLTKTVEIRVIVLGV